MVNQYRVFRVQTHLFLFRLFLVGLLFSPRTSIYWRLTTYVFSLIYYYFNITNENSLLKYISENTWIQTFIIFLTISSFINIFIPFTIRKEISKGDIEKISKETIEDVKMNEEIERGATF